MVITDLDLVPSIDTQLAGWPIDDIADVLIDYLVEREIHKLARVIHKLGMWDMLSVPSGVVELLNNGMRFAPVIESLDGVSTVIGIAEIEKPG